MSRKGVGRDAHSITETFAISGVVLKTEIFKERGGSITYITTNQLGVRWLTSSEKKILPPCGGLLGKPISNAH